MNCSPWATKLRLQQSLKLVQLKNQKQCSMILNLQTPKDQWSNEAEGKEAEENKHPDPHLFLISFIPYVPIDASLVCANPRLSGELNRSETHPAVLMGLDFTRTCRCDFVGHPLNIFFHFPCINHNSSPKVKSVYLRKVARQGLVPTRTNPCRQERRVANHML